jgi:glutamate-1-semialdehyde 2,1-aminomutase
VGNAGFIRPKDGFLQGLRALYTDHGSLLIFDEVITGFRLCWGGAQNLLGIQPDITTLGKIIGGGMPVAAFGGRREIMSCLAPLGKVYQAGTLSGNPLAMAAGLSTLKLLGRPGTYGSLTQSMATLVKGILELAAARHIPLQADGEGGLFGIFFADKPVTSYEEAKECNIARFKKFFKAIFQRGIYWAPSAFEAGFISTAHSTQDIQTTLRVMAEAFDELKA